MPGPPNATKNRLSNFTLSSSLTYTCHGKGSSHSYAFPAVPHPSYREKVANRRVMRTEMMPTWLTKPVWITKSSTRTIGRRTLCQRRNGKWSWNLWECLCLLRFGLLGVASEWSTVFGVILLLFLPCRTAKELNRIIEGTYVPSLSGAMFEGEHIPAPAKIPW